MASVSWISPPLPRLVSASACEDGGREHVARGDRQVAGRLVRRRFLDEVHDLEQLVVCFRSGDAVLAHLVVRHLFERDHGCRLSLVIAARHPLHDVAFGVHADDRVAERHDERLVADERPGARHGVAEPEQLALARVEILNRRALVLECRQQLLLAALAQRLNELGVQIEMVLDRRLSRSGDEEHARDAHARQLFDDVLHDRLAADGQHFLRLRFGGGQQPCAKAGDRDHGDVDGGVHGRRVILQGPNGRTTN